MSASFVCVCVHFYVTLPCWLIAHGGKLEKLHKLGFAKVRKKTWKGKTGDGLDPYRDIFQMRLLGCFFLLHCACHRRQSQRENPIGDRTVVFCLRWVKCWLHMRSCLKHLGVRCRPRCQDVPVPARSHVYSLPMWFWGKNAPHRTTEPIWDAHLTPLFDDLFDSFSVLSPLRLLALKLQVRLLLNVGFCANKKALLLSLFGVHKSL